MKTMLWTRTAALIGAALWMALPASAVPTAVVSSDTPPCDVLAIPTSFLDELGNPSGGFPIGEQISSATATSTTTACSTLTTDNTLVANARVSITNLNGIAFSDVWYVADQDTTLTNADGLVAPGVSAFKIDTAGSNTPLVFESILADGIFAPGETWDFIIQDYANIFSLSAAELDTIGVPEAGTLSSGSIIAVPVPEPTTAALLGLGVFGLALARRRAR
jgi:hypothetical protein